MSDDVDAVVQAVGPRLRALRQQRDTTLTQLSETTGISVSTLSRLESGQRRATLELLLPLTRALQVPLDQLLDDPPSRDPGQPGGDLRAMADLGPPALSPGAEWGAEKVKEAIPGLIKEHYVSLRPETLRVGGHPSSLRGSVQA